MTIRPRAVRLLEYLEAVRGLREQPVRDVAEYQDRRWWAGEIPAHPSCVLTATGDDPWLMVSKAQIPSAPPVPEDVAAHLRTGVTDPEREPAFAADLDDGYADNPEEAARLRELLRSYVEGPWRAWVPLARTALRTRKLYEDLYELRLRLQRESALIELVWGHGILSWAVEGTRIVHPMVTTQVQLSFDPDTGAISVEPEALVPHLEIDLLQGLGVNGFDLLVDLRDRFRTDPVGPFDERSRNLYEQLLAPLGLDGQVAEGTQPAAATSAPAITASWVLLVRRRSTMFRRFFANLRDALVSEQIGVAAPLAAVVADEPSRLDLDRGLGEDGSRRQAADRLLMPLPTNPEQEAVARRLAEHPGVTVQGPPGTGKTHTIANLISHLVGHGKRVLVTSQKEQALVVLRDKIPESIRDLSVAVLGTSAASLAQLDQSVQAIYEHAVGLDRAPARARIAALESHLGELHRDIGALRTRISASIARERDSYAIGTATHSPSTLGQWLAANAADLGYIPDEIDPSVTCQLSGAEIAGLYQLAKVLDPADCVQARLYLPVAEQLAPPSELASATAELRDIRDRLAGSEGVVEDRLALERLGPEGLFTLIDAVERAAHQLAELEQPWLAAIRAELRTAVFAATWRDQMKAWQEGIEELAAWQGRLLGHSVALPDGGLPPKELIEQLEQLRDRLAAGKGVSRTFQKDLHRVREACTVDEEPPHRAEDAELCITEARSRRRRYELIRGWNGAIGRIAGPLIDPGTGQPEYLLNQYMGGIGAAFAWEDRAWYALRDRLRACGVRVSEQATSASLTALADTLRTAALHITEKDLTARLDRVRKHLADGASHPQASRLWRPLLDAFDASAWDQWGQIIEEVRRIRCLTGDVARLDELTRRLAEVAPVWTSRIVGSRGDEAVAGPAATALRAWEWRQADTWLSAITGADDPATLQRQLESKLRAAATATADIASESAWLALAERLTDTERRALTAWAQALRKVGKGTGKYAQHWRAIAQQQMEQAQTAVPVWIMPTYRVVESFDPANAKFDVVIVDESSQCDLFGLAALGLADKAVVVGDDKQISPQAIGTDESAVHELIRQHIPDLPQAELLDIKTSLYDLSKMRFPGVIMLREHFRCLPEIIEFSNQLAYGGKILPLREQPADPTWQSVVDVHIGDGYREPGTDTNPPEADFIVGKIAELCADLRYDGKTFGVISLLGDAQAQLIQGKLIDRLGEQEVERRRIRCGNAYHFQGDERHVMFLSLVVAAGEGRRIGALTKEADRQRINVAASRAKDQMWCIRSISPDELHPDDVRGRFIRYCQNPARVDDATGQAEDSFDSDFERDVYRHLIARGYRVKVQHRVGRFRIDLVVEGRGGRLAVELDGDAYHGPDRWEADRNRQAILERLGWTFHRIRGSAYYRDPDTALASLWDRLEALGIRPADVPDPSPPPAVIVNSTVEETAAPADRIQATEGEGPMPMADAEEQATRSRRGSIGFSVDGQEVGGIESSTAVSDGSWEDWPPLSLAENDHILVWWLPEYDEAARQIVAEYQWVWQIPLLSHLETLIPEAILRAWRDSDPLCQEYSWYNVLLMFAGARAKKLGIFPRPAQRKVCSCCSREFLESELSHRAIARIGVNAIDVCETCLRQALHAKGSPESTPATVTAVLQALSGALRRQPKPSELNGRLDLRGLPRDARAAAVQALRVKPTVARVKELFGSWEAALAQAATAPPVPLPQYQSPPSSPATDSEFTTNDPARYRSLMGPVPDIVLDNSREPWMYRGEIESLIGAGYLALAEAALMKLTTLNEQAYLFSDLLAQVYGQTAREEQARAAISAMYHDGHEDEQERSLNYLLRPRDVRTITSGPVFYEPLPLPPRGNVCFVLIGGPMEYVDRRGQHRCISGEPPRGGGEGERAESVARMSAMVDGEPWMQAAAETGQAIIASLSRAGAASGLYGHLVCYMTTPFRQIVKALTGSLPKKLAGDAWSIAPVGKSRWSYQREAAHYVFNASAGFTFTTVEATPAVCIWGWPDRSDGCLQAFLDTVAVGIPDPVTVILPDVPAYRDFARRYVRRQRMSNSARTLIEDHLYRLNMVNKRGYVLTAEFAPRLVIHPDGSEDDGALLMGAIAYLDAHHTLRLSVWDLLRDGLLRGAALGARPTPRPFSVTASDQTDMVSWYGRFPEYDEPDVLFRPFRPSLLDAAAPP